MTTLDDLFQENDLLAALADGLVRRQTHPELPLAILNYTERAAYDRVWNQVTLSCRGLIYNVDTGEVLARPFAKFFNYGEQADNSFDLEARAVVTDKLDGSLGILYPTGERLRPARPGGPYSRGYAVATRGSFASDQAIHATDVWRTRYQDTFRPTEGITYLFEIVYPENRIVVDYEGLDDLVFIGAVNIASGKVARPVWPGLRVEEHPYRTLSQALAAEPRPNAEGLVVYLVDRNERVKIKQVDYVALHRIVTGLSKRTVWEHIGNGLPIEDLIEPLPDEFRPWIEDVVAELAALVASQAREIEEEYERIFLELNYGGVIYPGGETGDDLENGWTSGPRPAPRAWERKDFALLAKESPWSWALFNRLDGLDYGAKLWRNAKPEPVTPSGRVFTEDSE